MVVRPFSLRAGTGRCSPGMCGASTGRDPPFSRSRNGGTASRSALRIRRIANKYLDWERMIDHVAAVALVMLIRLDAPVRGGGPGQQGVSSGLLRCEPIIF